LFQELPVSSRGGTRTPDPVINSHLLYQLSYSGKSAATRRWNFTSGIGRVKPLLQIQWLGAHRNHRPHYMPHSHVHSPPHRLKSHTPDSQDVAPGKELGKAKHVEQPRGPNRPHVHHGSLPGLQPRVSVAAPLSGRREDRPHHDAVAIAIREREGVRVGSFQRERTSPLLQQHSRVRSGGGAAQRCRRQENARRNSDQVHQSFAIGYGWFATESSRAFRAAAESPALSAPRTPCAPGSREAPMALSLVR
jgi:hypothetical protein